MDGPAADAAADPEHLAHVEVLAVLGPVAERARLDVGVLVEEPALAEAQFVVPVVLLPRPRPFSSTQTRAPFFAST